NQIHHVDTIIESQRVLLVLHISEIFLNHYSILSILSEIQKKAPDWELNNCISIFITFFNCLNSLFRALHPMESTLRHLPEKSSRLHLLSSDQLQFLPLQHQQ